VRDLLRRIPEVVAAGVDGTAPAPIRDGSGVRQWVVESGMWRLETTTRDRFADADVALSEVAARVEFHRALGSLAPPKSGWAIVEGAGGGWWVWAVGLGLSTLDAHLRHAKKRGEADEVDRWLTVYATAAEEVVGIADRAGRIVRPSPARFAVLEGRCFFVGRAPLRAARARRRLAGERTKETR